MTIDEDELLAELQKITFHLSVLTHEIRSKAFRLFEQEVLKTDSRTKMFWAFNDNRSTAELAKIGDVTSQSARNLMSDLSEGGFISLRTIGQAQVPSPNFDRILDWYFSRPESKE